MELKTVIAILNYNGKKHLSQFLPSVIANSGNREIYVIDNASSDDSIDFLSHHFPSIKIIINNKNYGYAEGYNQGLQHINADIFVLLNSDVETSSNWINPIEEWFLNDEKLVACQPKILSFTHKNKFEHAGACGGFIDRYGYPFCRGRILDTYEEDNGQYDNKMKVFWATGACLFIRKKQFFEAGGFDADFFAHMEEIDLCWRLQTMGYTIGVEPKSVVYHLGGGTLNYMNPFKTKLNFRNNLFMLQKNTTKNRFTILLWRLILDGIAGAKFFVTGYWKHTWAVILAHYEFYFAIKKNKIKRKIFLKHNITQNNNLIGKYKRSIIFTYYFKRQRTYASIRSGSIS